MSALPFALRLTCCCCCWLTCIVILLRSSYVETRDFVVSDSNRVLTRLRRNGILDIKDEELPRSVTTLGVEEGVYDDESEVDVSYDGDEDEDYLETNTTEKGRYLGSPCDDTCSPNLQHVICDSVTGKCECEKAYPVQLGPGKGCAKPKKLGEQCFYRASCTFVDQHSTCAQVQHNAVCDCDIGYHRVVLSRPNKKVFCAEDLVLIKTDMATLLGVASGIAVFTGLICFVLKLFSRARYTRPRRYADANHAPPMLFTSDTGIPLTLAGRPSSRSSQRSDGGTLSCAAFTRRPSSGGSRGPLVPASRAGSRRPSLASIHSSTSSARSYSAKRLEKERTEKEQRQALQELRLARQRDQELQQQQQHQQQQPTQSQPTPSPRTPHSTDELLPAVEEGKEAFYNEVATTVTSTETPSVSKVLPQKLTTFSEQKPSDPLSIASTSLTVYKSINANETAFTAPSACTSAFNQNTAGNGSNVVDIFES